MNARARGVTLLELMVVMTIIGVLAAVAYPTYMQYTLRSNRTDALRALQLTAQALERCYSQNFSYVTPACTGAPAGVSASPNGYYNVTVAVTDGPPPDYTLTAVPNGPPQDADSNCQKIILDATAGQSALSGSGTSTTQLCWGSN